LIFQGNVTAHRGLEYFIPVLASKIQSCSLELTLLGSCTPEYKATLLNIASESKVTGKVFFDFVPYNRLPQITATCHIGLGVLVNNDIMHATVGTASNKLYEYAALGLPVLYYDNEHFRQYLGGYSWAFPVKLEPQSITNAIFAISQNFRQLSEDAHLAFLDDLNFEKAILDLKNYIGKY
ncbi:MAG: hypothetical protein ABI151_12570, partial [Chitinophagaceae bacterium]